jgi:hypothetical protein
MHDIKRTHAQNGVPPLTKQEIRESVAAFERALGDAFDELDTQPVSKEGT